MARAEARALHDRLAVMFVLGDRIGHYEVTREVAPAVYEGTHRVLPRRALIKVARGGAHGVALLREACLLEALQAAGVPKLYEAGQLADRGGSSDRLPWFAMELVGGESLATVLARGTLRAAEVVKLAAGLAEILELAHRRGIIHRGLRPDRIAIAARRICIADWSDARAHDAMHDAVDDRADVFSLGAIAYQALTGALPTPSLYVPAATRCKNAPIELTRLIDQMLAHDRFDRPSAGEVRAELAWLASVLETAPGEHVVLVDTDGVPEAPPVRLRKPRWTPPVSYVASDLADLVSGEIEVKP